MLLLQTYIWCVRTDIQLRGHVRARGIPPDNGSGPKEVIMWNDSKKMMNSLEPPKFSPWNTTRHTANTHRSLMRSFPFQLYDIAWSQPSLGDCGLSSSVVFPSLSLLCVCCFILRWCACGPRRCPALPALQEARRTSPGVSVWTLRPPGHIHCGGGAWGDGLW